MKPVEMPVRAVSLADLDIALDRRADGVIYARSPMELGPYPARLTDRLVHWARVAPERCFMAERGPDGDWRRLTYAETLAKVRAVGQALLDRGLGPERPLAIISGNDLEHAILGLAALHAGIPYAPISVAYSTLSTDFGKLRYILDLITPGLVFAADGAVFGRAIAATVPDATEVAVTRNPPDDRRTTLFSALAATQPGPAVDAAAAAVGPDTIGKFLFTSGSTGWPKGVINTQRMLTSNQEMLATVLAVLREAPPVIVDWLPWNHTFGGNHNVGIALYNGGTYYIDAGRPTPDATHHTVRNLREIAPTIYFNVPKGYEMLIPHLRDDRELAKNFFSRLSLTFYAAAGMPKAIWDALDEIAVKTCGERIVMLTGLGATESAPFALSCTPETSRSGHVGVPVPGLELKLVPRDGKLEARLKGPNITPGYWRRPDLNPQAFDEEGFYMLGDAVRFVDPDRPKQGFAFDGRFAEDFKLATGTWVSVGPLKARLADLAAPYVRDVVIAGVDRDEPTGLVIPDLAACRRLCADLPPDAPAETVLADPRLVTAFRDALAALAREASGSSRHVARVILLAEPPSIDAHEVTDKGTINQKAVLANRADLVEELYAEPYSERVIGVG